jgi:hypothetical protein
MYGWKAWAAIRLRALFQCEKMECISIFETRSATTAAELPGDWLVETDFGLVCASSTAIGTDLLASDLLASWALHGSETVFGF